MTNQEDTNRQTLASPESFVDLETRSPVDLRTHGAYRYFEHADTDVLIACYAIGDGEIGQWLRGDPCPPAIAEHIAAGRPVSGWNVFGFERLAFDAILGPRYGWPVPALEQYTDTMQAAAAMSLPRSLGGAAEALGLPIRKDNEGSRLIRRFSIPKKDGAWSEPEAFPDEFQRFVAYCRTDVEVERAIRARLVPLSDAEQAIAVLDARINSRGVRIDTISAASAIRLADKAKAKMDRDMRLVTGGYVGKCSEPGKLVAWVQSQGVELTSAAKAEITDLLSCDDLPTKVRRALEIRQEAAKTSVSKLNAMLARASADGRVRGSFLYHGASTGRWSNTGVNFANMPRPRRVYEDEHPRADLLFKAFRQEEPELLTDLYGPELGRPLHLLSDAIRGFVWSGPGRDLIQADYAGIEGAVIAWLAGEHWKVKALHEIAADPSLPDMYRRTAAAIMNTTTEIVTKKHPLRQSVGKVSELALGFGGGVSAFYSMSRNYGVNLDGLYAPVWEAADEERREKAVKRYEACLKRGTHQTDTLSREAWVACEIIKLGWRAANPAIAGSWKALEAAIRSAIENPGARFEAACCAYLTAHGFLWCRLPSGRCLAYGKPRLSAQVWAKVKLADGSWSDSEVMDRDAAEINELKGRVRIEGATAPRASALGVNSVTKKWERFGLYGGLAMENCTQAAARDLLVNGMLKAEAAGYPVIATVYDEIITEVPRGFGDVGEFERLICELPAWADGLPLTASGFRSKRYKKG